MSTRWRTPGFQMLAGLLVGLTIGLIVGWGIWPVRYYDTDPINLRPQQKAAYIALTGLVYGLDQDLDRARVRLYALGDPAIPSRVRSMANEYIKYGQDPEAVRGLAMLAQDLGVSSFTITEYLASPTLSPSPTLTDTVIATLTPTPSATLTPTAIASVATAMTATAITLSVTTSPTPLVTSESAPTGTPTGAPTDVATPAPSLTGGETP